MRTSLLLIILISFLSSNSQTKQFALIENIYSSWKKSANKYGRKCNLFLYSDMVIDEFSNSITQELFQTDSVFYSKQDTLNAGKIILTYDERMFLIKELQKLGDQKWTDKILPKSSVVSFLKIDSIQKSVNDQKLDPMVRLCYAVHTFSPPIFLRDNSICLFYFGKANFAYKEGEFWLYKKHKGKWTKFSPLYRWVD